MSRSPWSIEPQDRTYLAHGHACVQQLLRRCRDARQDVARSHRLICPTCSTGELCPYGRSLVDAVAEMNNIIERVAALTRQCEEASYNR